MNLNEIRDYIKSLVEAGDLWNKKYPATMIEKYLGKLPDMVYSLIQYIDGRLRSIDDWRTGFQQSYEKTSGDIEGRVKKIEDLKIEESFKIVMDRIKKLEDKTKKL